MKQQRLIPEGSLKRMLQAADESWQKREFQQSIEIMERASKLVPANYGLLLDLGTAYGKRYKYSDAERCFEKAVRVAPKNAGALAKAGRQCQSFGAYDMARHFLERATKENENTPDALVRLGEVYERLRLNQEAAQVANTALQKDANYAPAVLLKAKLEHRAGHLEDAEKSLRSLVALAPPALRVQVLYELGAILDRLGRYDDAMAAFVKAKAILQSRAAAPAAQLKVIRTAVKALAMESTAEILARWQGLAGTLRPAHQIALLGGHPRSGTTLLEQVLDSHPGVISSEETMIFYDDACFPLIRGFRDDAPVLSVLEAATEGVLLESRDRYFSSTELSIGQPVGDRLLIDKNPSLTFLIPAMIRVFPEIKFLIALRDPRDVCVSCFMQNLPLAKTSSAYLSLESTVEEYTSMMTIWRHLAPLMKNSWLEVRYEDMVEDLESVSRRALEFFGMPWDERVLKFNEHASQKAVRSPTYVDVTKPVFKRAVGRWRNYQKYLEPHLEKLEPFAKAFGYE